MISPNAVVAGRQSTAPSGEVSIRENTTCALKMGVKIQRTDGRTTKQIQHRETRRFTRGAPRSPTEETRTIRARRTARGCELQHNFRFCITDKTFSMYPVAGGARIMHAAGDGAAGQRGDHLRSESQFSPSIRPRRNTAPSPTRVFGSVVWSAVWSTKNCFQRTRLARRQIRGEEVRLKKTKVQASNASNSFQNKNAPIWVTLNRPHWPILDNYR